jgi:hypothetical protein
MAEQQSSKARRVLQGLYESAATRTPQQTRERPKLQLRADTPSLEANATTAEALQMLEVEQVDTLALHGSDGEPKAVVVSVGRYLALAAREAEEAPGVAANGHVWMPDESLKESHVEQVDPTQPWEALPRQVH